ncbi:MAG: hypothetical protein PHS86_07370 [Syntrophaceae bacterium]|nr:hypothetical protein [Syntrophaceae bacterium]
MQVIICGHCRKFYLNGAAFCLFIFSVNKPYKGLAQSDHKLVFGLDMETAELGCLHDESERCSCATTTGKALIVKSQGYILQERGCVVCWRQLLGIATIARFGHQNEFFSFGTLMEPCHWERTEME